MRSFIDQHRERFGVETTGKLLRVAPSACWHHAVRQRDPSLRSVRTRRDQFLIPHIQQVWQANFEVYGADKVWRQLQREGIRVARISSGFQTLPMSSTWQGFVSVAFVVDVFARRIVGWRVNRSMRTDFVLDALEQALYARQPKRDASLIPHPDRGSQYVSIRYTERSAEVGIEPSVGSQGDSHDNALAETINGSNKAEPIPRRAPWKTAESLELATLEWVIWFNHQRLIEPIG